MDKHRLIRQEENKPRVTSMSLLKGAVKLRSRRQRIEAARNTICRQVSAARSGQRALGMAPYGYRRAKISERGKMTILRAGDRSHAKPGDKLILVPGDAREISVVRQIFDQYVNKKTGTYRIAHALNEAGVRSPNGTKSGWSVDAIRKILMHPTYAGAACYNRSSRGELCCVRSEKPAERKDTGTRTPNPESEWIIVPDAYEPVVSQQLFDKAKEVRESRQARFLLARNDKQDFKDVAEPMYLVLGLLHCRNSASTMKRGKVYDKKSPTKKIYGSYRCKDYSRGKSYFVTHSICSWRIDAVVLRLATGHLRAISNSAGPSEGEAKGIDALKKALHSVVRRVVLHFGMYRKERGRKRHFLKSGIIEIRSTTNTATSSLTFGPGALKRVSKERLNEYMLAFSAAYRLLTPVSQ